MNTLTTISAKTTDLYCAGRAWISHTMHTRKEAGQGSIEYLGLFAIVAIAVFVGAAAFNNGEGGQGALAGAMQGVIDDAFEKALSILGVSDSDGTGLPGPL